MATKKTRCIFCGKEKSKTGFFAKSDSSLLADDLSVCKTCAKKIGKIEELSTIHFILKLLDKPFINSVWQDALINRPNEPLGKYLSLICGSQYRDYATYNDGEKLTEEIKSNSETVNEEKLSKTKTQLLKEWEQFWGPGFEFSKYEFLENELFKLKTDFECTDYGMEMILKDISFINLQIYYDRQEGKDVQKLIKTRGELMNDGKLKPIQATGADKNEKVSLGVFIKKYENEAPIDEYLTKEMKQYIQLYIPAHVAKMEGLDNDLTRKYEEELNNYTINFDDIYGIESEDE